MKNKLLFVEGAVAALALGVAAAMFLNSKTGKKVKAEAGDMMGDFYKVISPRLKKIKKMGHGEYDNFMKEAAEKYGKTKKMGEDKIKELVKDAQGSWKHFSKHLGA